MNYQEFKTKYSYAELREDAPRSSSVQLAINELVAAIRHDAPSLSEEIARICAQAMLWNFLAMLEGSDRHGSIEIINDATKVSEAAVN